MKYLQNNQEFRFNEVLFEHRNKAYGAYALRNESDRILTKSLFVGVGLLAAISITPLIISAFRSDVPVEIPADTPPPVFILDKVDRPDTPPAKVDVVKPVSPPDTKQYNSSVVTPKRDAVEPVKQDKPDDAVPGLVNNLKGEPVTPHSSTPAPPTIGTGHLGPYVAPPVIKDAGNTIASPGELSQEASYGGGIDSFRKKVMDNFDGSGFEGSGDTMKTVITFVVEKDGTISGIKANGSDASFNNEAIRTIKSIRGAWKPAKNKQGEPVRSYFKFPVSMRFE